MLQMLIGLRCYFSRWMTPVSFGFCCGEQRLILGLRVLLGGRTCQRALKIRRSVSVPSHQSLTALQLQCFCSFLRNGTSSPREHHCVYWHYVFVLLGAVYRWDASDSIYVYLSAVPEVVVITLVPTNGDFLASSRDWFFFYVQTFLYDSTLYDISE